MSQVHQKRYNLMIIGEDVIKKLDSLPERHKGMYVSEVLVEKLRLDEDSMCKAASLIVPSSGNYSKGMLEDLIRKVVREEITKI